MHMSDALLSPAVGGAMWTASAVAVAHSARRMGQEMDSRRIPLMGVLAAFVFAGQMINFTIPGTGSSGHLGGGVILAVILGPHAALLAMASILTVQALFFADGGLLALGCNIFNIGFIPAFIAYPLVFRPLAGDRPGPRRLMVASLAAGLTGLTLGALGVVLQTVFSGISDLRLGSFTAIMLPIHLVIGVVEGLITAAVVTFVWKERPEILRDSAARASLQARSLRRLIAAFAVAAAVTGGVLTWFASSNPDGLEWALRRVAGPEGAVSPGGGIHSALEGLQEKTALLPDYQPRDGSLPGGSGAGSAVSGIVGGSITLLLALLIGYLSRRRPVAGKAGGGG
jgi:cobalt/nickel transport system permease protein